MVKPEVIFPEPSVDSLLVAKYTIGLVGKCGGDLDESNAPEYQTGGKTVIMLIFSGFYAHVDHGDAVGQAFVGNRFKPDAFQDYL